MPDLRVSQDRCRKGALKESWKYAATVTEGGVLLEIVFGDP